MFRHLPTEIKYIIWSYDDNMYYKNNFNNCLFQMNAIFNKNRVNSRILFEIHVHNISSRILYHNQFSFYHFILLRIRNNGFDPCFPDVLEHLNFTTLNFVS